MNSRVPGALACVATVAMLGCGPSHITSARIQGAIETTFANLVELQMARLGLPPMRAVDVAVNAACRRQVALSANEAGAGNWACTLVWQGPDRWTLRDTFDLFVTADGCYTATVNGESLGGPTLKASDGRVVRNLLYTFEGCFDTVG